MVSIPKFFFSTIDHRPSTIDHRLLLRAASARGCHHPAAARLSLAKLLAQLASRIRDEQLARVEPMRRGRASKNRRELTRELFHVGAAVMPERHAVGHFV